jgi:hypothetical protein
MLRAGPVRCLESQPSTASVLIEHEATDTGQCQNCPSSAWPCPVVTTVHALVKDPDRQFTVLLRRAREQESGLESGER